MLLVQFKNLRELVKQKLYNVSNLEDRIKEGIDGKFQGLSNGFKRINKYIFGLQKKCMYLLGGQSGTFKTTLADFILMNALFDAEKKGIKTNVFYYSFEIDEITKKCNWLSNIVYQKYNKVIAPETIKGLGDFRLTEEEHEIVKDCIPDLELIWSKINFIFQPINPTGIKNDIWKFMETRGIFEYENYVDHEGKSKQKIKSYKLNDPNEFNIIIMDHLYLMKKERGFLPKEVIDKYSEYCMELRNMFGCTIFNIQQFNDGLSSVERMKFKGVDLSPQMSDYKDTRNTYQDSDIVLGLMNPSKLDMEECMGYDLSKIENLIMLKIIKNRLSQDNIAIALQANPKAGNFIELPYPKDIDYSKYIL